MKNTLNIQQIFSHKRATIKNFVILGVCLLNAGYILGQNKEYLHFNVGGGANGLNYQIKNGIQKEAFGITMNAAYSYFFNENWGIQSGLGLQSFGANSTLNLFTTEQKTDQEGESYELRTMYKDWNEKQTVWNLEIPVTAQYRYSINSKFGLIGSAGAKIGFPVSHRYQSMSGSITTTGYYSQYNLVLYDLKDYGFYTTTATYKGKIDVDPAFMGVADIGGLYKLSDQFDIYFGGYFNYGFNNILNPDNKTIFLQDGTYNGIMASTQTSRIRPVSFGVKAGIYWQLKHEKTVPQTVKLFLEDLLQRK